MKLALAVGLGGAVGAMSRYGVARLFARWDSWPVGTLAINVTGCFIIGAFLATMAARQQPFGAAHALVTVGFVGAYTTFSTYAYEMLHLANGGRILAAVGYFTLSNVTGLFAVWLGELCARRLS